VSVGKETDASLGGPTGVIESGGQSSGFLVFFLITPATNGIRIKNKITIKNLKLADQSGR
jgi:hypothetical protein